MSKEKKERKSIDEEFIRVLFRKESANGMLKLFKAKQKFRDHCRNAIVKLKLSGDSMLKEVKKISAN